ncbi:MAG TPA: NADH-quinone oxidoreductase [Henriciella marina]|uniref:cation:proton antiporter subunit C n=1 Tax=Henriciella sp. TaxID=1968823 RepID=UPI0017C1BD86|nr:cation:proton antiporter subunit C [Henriciella sp.]HIG21989.1 NADH-quinone oxidoreductase [Henriciella sp.]HIK65550.1 NADH-quinone oxidoreductase [Henriciella marina]
MLDFVLERGNYWAIIGLMMLGLYTLFAATNLIKKLVGLSIFQTSIILFYISLSRIDGGTAPILYGKDAKGHGGGHDEAAGAYGAASDAAHGASDAAHGAADAAHGAASHGLEHVYSNPLPHVLMLTAIVVGVATLAVGLAIVVRIREAYGTIESDEIRETDLEVARAEYAVDHADEANPA